MCFRKWKNKIMNLKSKESNYLFKLFSWSYRCSVCLLQKVFLTSKTKQNVTPNRSPKFCGNLVHAKTRPEWTNQSNGSIGGQLEFVTGRLNTSALLYRFASYLRRKDNDSSKNKSSLLNTTKMKLAFEMCIFKIGMEKWQNGTMSKSQCGIQVSIRDNGTITEN